MVFKLTNIETHGTFKTLAIAIVTEKIQMMKAHIK
jgi:hypothetical protein